MINGKSILAIIPARGGSKGVPRKNIRELAGKPLIAWTIEEAKKSKYIDRLIVSTEDTEIVQVAQAWDCEVPFVRPKELALDDTPSSKVVLHALHRLPKHDYVMLLQPTSPFRTVEDIDGCIQYCEKHQAVACVSVTEPDKSPFWMYVLDYMGRMQPLIAQYSLVTRRQDLSTVYALNGAIYIAQWDWFLQHETFIHEQTLAYVMPRERSLDIDTEFDFELASALLRSKE